MEEALYIAMHSRDIHMQHLIFQIGISKYL